MNLVPTINSQHKFLIVMELTCGKWDDFICDKQEPVEAKTGGEQEHNKQYLQVALHQIIETTCDNWSHAGDQHTCQSHPHGIILQQFIV